VIYAWCYFVITTTLMWCICNVHLFVTSVEVKKKCWYISIWISIACRFKDWWCEVLCEINFLLKFSNRFLAYPTLNWFMCLMSPDVTSGYIWRECSQSWVPAENFPGEIMFYNLLILFRSLMMQCKWMFTKHFNFSMPQKKCPKLQKQP